MLKTQIRETATAADLAVGDLIIDDFVTCEVETILVFDDGNEYQIWVLDGNGFRYPITLRPTAKLRRVTNWTENDFAEYLGDALDD